MLDCLLFIVNTIDVGAAEELLSQFCSLSKPWWAFSIHETSRDR